MVTKTRSTTRALTNNTSIFLKFHLLAGIIRIDAGYLGRLGPKLTGEGRAGPNTR